MSSVNVTVQFKADAAPLNREMAAMREAVSRFAANASSKMADVSTAIRNSFRVGQVIADALAEPFRQFSRYDDALERLGSKLGNLDDARALCDKLRNSAAAGTQSFEALVDTAGKLSSVFKSSADIEAWTDVFHNLSAGLGRDINELVENFVRSKASGRFEGGFLDMFAQKGVNIFEILSAQTGKTAVELRAMATAGTL